MIRLTDSIWIGNSADEAYGDLDAAKIGAILNVAQDLHGSRRAKSWKELESMKVGLIDGPGNPPSAYVAAAMALDALVRRNRTLVCCHSGSRSVAVVLMYLNLASQRGWDEWLEILRERVDEDLPRTHQAHRAAFEDIDWRSFEKVIGGLG